MKTLTKLAGLAAATGFAVLASLPAAAREGQTGRGGEGDVTLRACNRTRDAVLVAGSYIPPGNDRWRNKGWTRVNAGSCQDIFHTENRTFYVRAEVKGDSSQFWGTDIMQCVEYPGPYDFYTGSDDTTCPEGEPQKFTTIHSDGRSVFVWNLDP